MAPNHDSFEQQFAQEFFAQKQDKPKQQQEQQTRIPAARSPALGLAVLVERVLVFTLLICSAWLVHECHRGHNDQTRAPAVAAMSARLVVEMWHITMAWSKLDHLRSRMWQLVALCVCIYCTNHAVSICEWIYACSAYLGTAKMPQPVAVYSTTFALLLLGVMVQWKGMDAPEEPLRGASIRKGMGLLMNPLHGTQYTRYMGRH